MYIPHAFAESELPTLFAFIDAHPLATIVTSPVGGNLVATHLPLVLDRTAGELGTLRGHFARANPHAHALRDRDATSLVIFTGPDAYITPTWYAAKAESGRVVPTWNYIAVHVYGALRINDSADFLRQHLETLTARHEGERSHPWRIDDAPDEYVAQQLKAIVGVEIQIERIEGKWKMSQNRSDADIDGVVIGLGASDSPRDREVGAIVDQRRPKA